MASLFTPEYMVTYKVILWNGESKNIRFTSENYIYNEEECFESDVHECYDKNGYRYVLYARDIYETKTLTYLSLFEPDIERDNSVSKMYINNRLIYSDKVLNRKN
jgi:hypothetical protein